MALEPVPEDWDRCLAVVAHPDDLEYGCAAALSRWSGQGKTVIEVLATRGEAGIDTMAPQEAAEVRSQEQAASAAVVGASTLEFLDHPDGTLRADLDLRRDLARAIRRHRPDVVVTISFREGFYGGPRVWNHADHRALGEALLDAVRDAANRWVFPELVEEGHEPWSGVRHTFVSASPLATHYVDVTDTIGAVADSLHCHAAYLAALGDPDGASTIGWLTESLRQVGAEVGVGAAVAVELL
jgi:LmbE family N-acetylglucosaminyl deacetylase